MKKRLLIYFLLIGIIFCGCSKTSMLPADTKTGDPQKSFSVRYSMTDFEFDVNGHSANKQIAAKDYLDYLFYGAYDSTGKLVRKIEQGKRVYPYNMNGFGLISDSLKSGKYTIVLAGTKDSMLYESGFNQLNSLQLSGFFPQDVFYKKFTLTIAGNDTSVTNINMGRLTGLLEVVITDTLANKQASMIVVGLENSAAYYNVGIDSLEGNAVPFGSGYYPNQTWQSSMAAFDGFYWSSTKSVTVKLMALNGNRQNFKQKIIQNVLIYPNKKTILTGSLFYGSGTSTASRINLSTDKKTIVQGF